MAASAALVLLFNKAAIFILDRPVSDNKPGRWAPDAHDVIAVEERPMSHCGQVLHDLHEGKLKNRVAVIPDSLFVAA